MEEGAGQTTKSYIVLPGMPCQGSCSPQFKSINHKKDFETVMLKAEKRHSCFRFD